MKTNENANQKYSTGHPLVEFFSKAGSLFEKRESFYGSEASALDLFHNAWAVDKVKAFKLMLWCRDVRGGAGNRSGSRKILNWLATNQTDWVAANLPLVPEYGRWDDLFALIDTPVEKEALALWASAIKDGNGLACKWAPRENKSNKGVAKKLRSVLGYSPKEYRKAIVDNTNVVETAMCNNSWGDIEYSSVPSVAMSRYGKAFKTHDPDGFSQFIEDVNDPNSTEKVNAGALFPHDLMKAFKGGSDRKLIDSQFEAMPDYFNTDMRVMSLVDMSSSMGVKVAGDTSAMDIAVSLSMFASDRLGKDNPFWRKVIPYSTDASFYSWQNSSGFTSGVDGLFKCHRYMGATNLSAAFKLLRETGSFLNVTPDQMPNTILIVSDMQFSQAVSANDKGGWYSDTTVDKSKTLVESELSLWDAAGYDRPNIVFWNTAGYAGSPEDVFAPNTGLVSGFSPSILKAVFEGDDFTPMGIMERTIEKYKISVPQ